MKKLLSLLAALGMAATTSATAATVVSCGDKGASSNDEGPGIEDNKYQMELDSFKLLVQETMIKLISEASTSKEGIYYTGDNPEDVKDNKFFGETMDEVTLNSIISFLQKGNKDQANSNNELLTAFKDNTNLNEIMKAVTKIVTVEGSSSFPTLLTGINEGNMDLKTDLVFTDVSFTPSNEDEGKKGDNTIQSGTISIGFDVLVSLKILTTDGKNKDNLSITSSNRTGITLASSKDVLNSIASLSDLLSNPFSTTSKENVDEEVKSKYNELFTSLENKDNGFLNMYTFAEEAIEGEKAVDKYNTLFERFKKLVEVIAKPNQSRASNIKNISIEKVADINTQKISVVKDSKTHIFTNGSSMNWAKFKSVEQDNELNPFQRLMRGKLNIFQDTFNKTNKGEIGYNKLLESKEKLENSALSDTYKTEKVTSNYNITIELEEGTIISIKNKEFTFTLGGKADEKANDFNGILKALDAKFNERWSLNLKDYGIDTTSTDKGAQIITNKTSKFNKELTSEDKGGWSETQNRKKNWITEAISKTGLGLKWDYPAYVDAGAQKVSLDEEGYKIASASTTFSNTIRIQIANFKFGFVAPRKADSNNDIALDLLKPGSTLIKFI